MAKTGALTLRTFWLSGKLTTADIYTVGIGGSGVSYSYLLLVGELKRSEAAAGTTNGLSSNVEKWIEVSATLIGRNLEEMDKGVLARYIEKIEVVRRSKGLSIYYEVAEGDLVMVVDGAVRNQWIRGIVEKVIQGSDGRVRQAWIRTANGVLRRPVVKLALLVVVDGGKPETSHDGLRVEGCDDEYPSARYGCNKPQGVQGDPSCEKLQ